VIACRSVTRSFVVQISCAHSNAKTVSRSAEYADFAAQFTDDVRGRCKLCATVGCLAALTAI
jgi:hypothetical protein